MSNEIPNGYLNCNMCDREVKAIAAYMNWYDHQHYCCNCIDNISEDKMPIKESHLKYQTAKELVEVEERMATEEELESLTSKPLDTPSFEAGFWREGDKSLEVSTTEEFDQLVSFSRDEVLAGDYGLCPWCDQCGELGDLGKGFKDYTRDTFYCSTQCMHQSEIDEKLVEDPRNYNIGGSDYSQYTIQPWDIWLEYDLNPWDADIVKRVLRTKEGDSRKLDYEKIIHICNERIRQIGDE